MREGPRSKDDVKTAASCEIRRDLCPRREGENKMRMEPVFIAARYI